MMLRYERAAIAAGELWRGISAHLVHLGFTHTLLNLAGFVLVIWLFRTDIRRWEWLTVGLVAAVTIAFRAVPV